MPDKATTKGKIMADTFDLVVLGSGPGGYVAAIRAAQLGLRVAIVEREKLGGICLNWGCIPTKALLRSSEVYHYITHADAYGLSVEKPSFDLAKVVDRSRKVAGQLNSGVKGLMKKNKITVVEGEGKIVAKGRLSVARDGKTTELEAKNIIIATGARARDLPFAKADGKRIWTYRHALVPPEMPKKLLVIGSGPGGGGEGKVWAKGRHSGARDGKTTELEAKNISTATGARARDLPFAKADGKRIWTYRHAMVPPEMPKKLLVIGSGAIGVEFASFYSDMGADVTIVEMLDRILPVEDAEVSDFMAKALTKQGMKILTGEGVEKLEATSNGVKAAIKGADGDRKSTRLHSSH